VADAASPLYVSLATPKSAVFVAHGFCSKHAQLVTAIKQQFTRHSFTAGLHQTSLQTFAFDLIQVHLENGG